MIAFPVGKVGFNLPFLFTCLIFPIINNCKGGGTRRPATLIGERHDQHHHRHRLHRNRRRRHRNLGNGRDAEASLAAAAEFATDGDVTGLKTFPATAALIAKVEAEGGAIAWSLVDGICCTCDEADDEA